MNRTLQVGVSPTLGCSQFKTNNMADIKTHSLSIVEALVFAAPGPITASRIAQIASVPPEEVDQIVDKLNELYENSGRAFRINRIAGGYQFFTITTYAPYVSELFVDKGQIHLTRAMLEVLSIVALKQPVTKPVIDKIRGADSSAPVRTLLENGLITIRRRQKSPGRPFLYGTTEEFLKLFGLERLEDLPKAEELAGFFDEKGYSIPEDENEEQSTEESDEEHTSELENEDVGEEGE